MMSEQEYLIRDEVYVHEFSSKGAAIRAAKILIRKKVNEDPTLENEALVGPQILTNIGVNGRPFSFTVKVSVDRYFTDSSVDQIRERNDRI